MHVNVAVAQRYGFSSWIKKSGVQISRHAFNYLQPQKYAQKSTASPLDNWKIKGYLELGLQPQLKIILPGQSKMWYKSDSLILFKLNGFI